MKTVEIVSHCYSVKLPHYSACLTYQLSGFLLHPPKSCRVLPTICTTFDDERTLRVLNFFRDKMCLRTILMKPEEIGRRSIGRNQAARGSDADLVWFADVDQVFHGECLDDLIGMEWPSQDGRRASMVFPRQIKISRDHATGDAATRGVLGEPAVVDIDPSEFVDKTYNVAIGGVQIVQGDDARQYGYLNRDARYQQPRTDGLPFKEFKDDLQFRKVCNRRGPIVGIELPGLYRIRHLETTH
jgi:hypothetical protein